MEVAATKKLLHYLAAPLLAAGAPIAQSVANTEEFIDYLSSPVQKKLVESAGEKFFFKKFIKSAHHIFDALFDARQGWRKNWKSYLLLIRKNHFAFLSSKIRNFNFLHQKFDFALELNLDDYQEVDDLVDYFADAESGKALTLAAAVERAKKCVDDLAAPHFAQTKPAGSAVAALTIIEEDSQEDAVDEK